MKIEDLTPEQLEKLKSCETAAQVVEFAASEGIELTDEQLEQVSGGGWGSEEQKGPNYQKCPKCGSYHTCIITNGTGQYDESTHTYCYDCKNDHYWFRAVPIQHP